MRAYPLALAAVITLGLSGLAACDPSQVAPDAASDVGPDGASCGGFGSIAPHPEATPCIPGRAPAPDALKPYCHELGLDLLTAELGTPLFADTPGEDGGARISPSIHWVTSGADLEIVGGQQGLHMVVLGFRTAAVTQGNLQVSATFTTQSGEEVTRKWGKRGIQDGCDGYGYGLDLILTVDGKWRDWVDHPATVTLVVSTTDGLLIGRSVVDVTLRSLN